MYAERIIEIDNNIKKLLSEKETVLKAWCELDHPLSVGDIVNVTGYSHTGKQMCVDRIEVHQGYSGWKWYASGKIIKLDGTPGFNFGEWTQKIKE